MSPAQRLVKRMNKNAADVRRIQAVDDLQSVQKPELNKNKKSVQRIGLHHH